MGKKKLLFSQKNMIWVCVLVGLLLSLKSIVTDFGIDAEYQVAMGHRMLQGDRLLADMWEPHQTSAFLCAVLEWFYVNLTGTLKGLVLFQNAVGALIRAGIALLLYRTVKRHASWQIALAGAFFYAIMAPKDVLMPEFSNMQLWFSTLFCICLITFLDKKKTRYLLLSVGALCVTVLSYPSCAILLLGGIFLLYKYSDRKGMDILILCGGCALLGMLYLSFVLWVGDLSPGELMGLLPRMLSLEPTHDAGLISRLEVYFSTIWKLVLVAVLGSALLWVIGRYMLKVKQVFAFILQGIYVFSFLYALFSVLTLQMRFTYSLLYLPILFCGACFANRLSDGEKRLYICGQVISALAFLATLIFSDLVFTASVPYLILGVSTAFLPIGKVICKKEQKTKKRLTFFAVCFFALMAFRGIFILRPLNGQIDTVLSIRGIVKEGPATGMLMEYMGAYMQNVTVPEYEELIPAGSSVYIIGGDGMDPMGYLYEDLVVAAPSVQCTPAYNDNINYYFATHPDKYPDVCIVPCWYGELQGNLQDEDSYIMNWIENAYKPSQVVDGKYWRYYFR